MTQPGLRYAQADALINSLLQDGRMSDLSLAVKTRVLSLIRSEIQGRMMKDMILLETKIASPKKQVFKLQFAVGEYDMMRFDPVSASCEIYEIKHSTEAVPEQTRFLLDEQYHKATEHSYGTIVGTYVIYSGEDQTAGDVQYRNVEGYLKELAGK